MKKRVVRMREWNKRVNSMLRKGGLQGGYREQAKRVFLEEEKEIVST